MNFDNPDGYSDNHLRDATQRAVNTYAKFANKRFRTDIPIPVPVVFNLENISPKSAGRAHGSMLIEINMIMLRDNTDEMINQIVPHEVAHLVQFKKFNLLDVGTQGHGAEWQEIMKELGKDPLKKHQFDITKAVAHYKAHKKASKKK